jgi:hypothetical protein
MPEKAYEILGYGVIGLGFLLAVLAYWLLTKEQKKDKVRKPMISAIHVFMGFSVFLCVLGLASEFIKGREPPAEDERGKPDSRIQELEARLQGSIAPEEFSALVGAPAAAALDKNAFRETVKELAVRSKELDECAKHYGFHLLKIERIMPNYGNSIDTRIQDDQRNEVYKLLQVALREINRYSGTINGDQSATYRAVKDFQRAWNAGQPSPIFSEDDIGLFGYRTLEAVRSAHRSAD